MYKNKSYFSSAEVAWTFVLMLSKMKGFDVVDYGRDPQGYYIVFTEVQ